MNKRKTMKHRKKNEQEEVIYNKSLNNILTPLGGLTFNSNSIEVGEYKAKIQAVIRYPTSVSTGWLSKQSNIQGTIATYCFEPEDSSELVQAIARNISLNNGIAMSTADPLTRQRAEKTAEDGERIMKQIDQAGESVGYMSSMIMPMAYDGEELAKIITKTESTFSTGRMNIRGMTNTQKEAYKSISPYHVPDEKIQNSIKRIVPLSTFLGGFPFSSIGHSDDRGYFFAKDSSKGLVMLDSWKRGGDRTNSNWVVMGQSGQGKSVALKHLMLQEYAKGTKIICIDPESECKKICMELEGDWINAGGNDLGRINPLEIKKLANVDEEDMYDNESVGMGAMALHLKTLEIFFALYLPTVTEIQKALLKEALEELYNSFNIFWDTDVSKLTRTDFPIFSDLYNLLLKKKEENQSTDYEILQSLLRDIAKGADSFIWNGHSTVNTNSNFIVLDTRDLVDMSVEVKRTQYFNLLNWCWDKMSENREENVLLFCDEAYLLIDPNIPQSLVFLRNVAKRARKYQAGLVIASHSVVDFLSPNIKQYGQALLDSACYKVLLGTDGQDLIELVDLYHLGEAEQDFLLSKIRGNAIFIFGGRKMRVEFYIPEFERKYIGIAGGRWQDEKKENDK